MDVLSSLDVARELGCPEWRLDKAIRRGLIPAPRIVGGSRVWTRDLVEQLRDAIGHAGTRGRPGHDPVADGESHD